MKSLEVTIKLRNNLVKSRRLALGLSQKQLATLIKVSHTVVSHIECFHHGASQETYQKFANFFDITVEEIFPEWIKYIKQSTFVKEVDEPELLRLAESISTEKLFLPPPSPEKQAYTEEIKNLIRQSLNTLTPREELIITKRFGLDGDEEKSFDEIGESLEVSGGRVRQIESKAFRKLRQPTHRSKSLKEAWE
jgi:RNA polymerase primary sigma factor